MTNEKIVLLAERLRLLTERDRIRWHLAGDLRFCTVLEIDLKQYCIYVEKRDGKIGFAFLLNGKQIEPFIYEGWVEPLWDVARMNALDRMGVYDELLKELGSLENES